MIVRDRSVVKERKDERDWNTNARDYVDDYQHRYWYADYKTLEVLKPLYYLRNRTTFRATPGERYTHYAGSKYGPYVTSAPDMSQVVNSDVVNNLKTAAQLSALSNLHDNMRASEFSLGVCMLEGASTAGLIYDTSKRIFNAYRAVKKGRFSAAADELFMDPPSRKKEKAMRNQMKRGSKGFLNNWMAYRYGFVPLMSDVQESIKAHAAIMGRVESDIIYRGFSRQDEVDAGSFSSTFASRLSSYTVCSKIYDRERFRASALRINTPGAIIYELTPLSFVFDWWLPVGEWLNAWYEPEGFEFKYGCLSDKRITTAFVTDTEPLFSGTTRNGSEHTVRPYGEYRDQRFERIPLDRHPVVGPLPIANAIDRAMNLARAVDSVAILTNLVKGK